MNDSNELPQLLSRAEAAEQQVKEIRDLAGAMMAENTVEGSRVTGKCLDHYASRLATFISTLMADRDHAREEREKEEQVQEFPSRVVDSQYDPPSARPLATAGSNDVVPALLTALKALKALRIDANRLCDRNLGGTYEEDCRRAIAIADAAIVRASAR